MWQCPPAGRRFLKSQLGPPLILCKVKTSATSQWSFRKNDMTAVTKKPQDARELILRTAGEGDSLVQFTFG